MSRFLPFSYARPDDDRRSIDRTATRMRGSPRRRGARRRRRRERVAKARKREKETKKRKENKEVSAQAARTGRAGFGAARHASEGPFARRRMHAPHAPHAPPTSGASERASSRPAGPSESRARQRPAETAGVGRGMSKGKPIDREPARGQGNLRVLARFRSAAPRFAKPHGIIVVSPAGVVWWRAVRVGCVERQGARRDPPRTLPSPRKLPSLPTLQDV